MRRFVWLLMSLIPGAPAVLKGRYGWGFAWMSTGLLGANVAWMAWSGMLDVPRATAIGAVAAAVSAGSWISCFIWTLLTTSPARQRTRAERAEAAYVAACEHYLRGAFDHAEAALARGIKAAREDADLAFVAYQLAVARGEERLARRRLRRLRRFDTVDKWAAEIEQSRERLHRGRSKGGARAGGNGRN